MKLYVFYEDIRANIFCQFFANFMNIFMKLYVEYEDIRANIFCQFFSHFLNIFYTYRKHMHVESNWHFR
jgi:hypothetical protein